MQEKTMICAVYLLSFSFIVCLLFLNQSPPANSLPLLTLLWPNTPYSVASHALYQLYCFMSSFSLFTLIDQLEIYTRLLSYP